MANTTMAATTGQTNASDMRCQRGRWAKCLRMFHQIHVPGIEMVWAGQEIWPKRRCSKPDWHTRLFFHCGRRRGYDHSWWRLATVGQRLMLPPTSSRTSTFTVSGSSLTMAVAVEKGEVRRVDRHHFLDHFPASHGVAHPAQ